MPAGEIRTLLRPPIGEEKTGWTGATRLAPARVGFGVGVEPPTESAQVLAGVALCTRGAALGHYFWCDAAFVSAVAAATNVRPQGLKSRFTHPDFCNDGLGKLVGHIVNGRLDGDVARGDLKLSDVGRETPMGDLVGYVQRLAAEHAEDFGLSIVFTHDAEAEQQFLLDHGAEWAADWWGPCLSLKNFKSPDPDNVDNLPHARLKGLHACDVVDEPAANPHGLFHRGPSIPVRYLDARGRAAGSKEKSMPQPAPKKPSLLERLKSLFGAPKPPALSADQERSLGQFLSAFEGEEQPVPSNDTPPADTSDDDAVHTTCPECGHEFPVDPANGESLGEGDDKPDGDEKKDAQENGEPGDQCDDEPKDKEEGDEKKDAQRRGSLANFMKAFGDASGARYFADGLTFEQAALKHGEKTRKLLAEKDRKLKALRSGEGSPLSAIADDLKAQAKQKLAAGPIDRIAAGCVPKATN